MARHLFPTILTFLLASALALPQGKKIEASLNTDVYIPVVVVGGGWSQQIIIQNVDEDPISGTMEIFTEKGDPWEIEIEGQGKGDTFFVNLLPKQMEVFEIPRSLEEQISGYAKLDLACCVWGSVQTVYRREHPEIQDFAASVVVQGESLRGLDMMIDNRDGNFTAVGILTTRTCYSFSCESAMDIVFRDKDGIEIFSHTKTQKNRTFEWVILEHYPELAGKMFNMEVRSGDPDREYLTIVAASFQMAPNGVMTAIASVEH